MTYRRFRDLQPRRFSAQRIAELFGIPYRVIVGTPWKAAHARRLRRR